MPLRRWEWIKGTISACWIGFCISSGDQNWVCLLCGERSVLEGTQLKFLYKSYTQFSFNSVCMPVTFHLELVARSVLSVFLFNNGRRPRRYSHSHNTRGHTHKHTRIKLSTVMDKNQETKTYSKLIDLLFYAKSVYIYIYIYIYIMYCSCNIFIRLKTLSDQNVSIQFQLCRQLFSENTCFTVLLIDLNESMFLIRRDMICLFVCVDFFTILFSNGWPFKSAATCCRFPQFDLW